jgi:aminoglycoside N3'-acetyltransferase
MIRARFDLTDDVIAFGELLAQLRAMGLRAGDLVMVHASLPAIGPLARDPRILLDALLDCVGRDGTVVSYVSWQHSSYDATRDGRELSASERKEWPVFDPATAPPYEGFGGFNQAVCDHPLARRSAHPEASIAAIGRHATDLIANHQLLDAYGPSSPLGRFVQWRGRVLMLGAPPGAITALRVAEVVARIPGKRRVRYQVPLRVNGERCWREAEEFDSDALIDTLMESDMDPVGSISTDYVAEGNGLRGHVGSASCWMFEAQHLVSFGVGWLESRFAATPIGIPATSGRNVVAPDSRHQPD